MANVPRETSTWKSTGIGPATIPMADGPRATGDVDVLGEPQVAARAAELVAAEDWHPSRGPRPTIAELQARGYHWSQRGWTRTVAPSVTEDDDFGRARTGGDPFARPGFDPFD